MHYSIRWKGPFSPRRWRSPLKKRPRVDFPGLKADALTKRYGKACTAVDDVSFEVAPGA
jgi:hypothetical protein